MPTATYKSFEEIKRQNVQQFQTSMPLPNSHDLVQQWTKTIGRSSNREALDENYHEGCKAVRGYHAAQMVAEIMKKNNGKQYRPEGVKLHEWKRRSPAPCDVDALLDKRSWTGRGTEDAYQFDPQLEQPLIDKALVDAELGRCTVEQLRKIAYILSVKVRAPCV